MSVGGTAAVMRPATASAHWSTVMHASSTAATASRS